MQARRATLAGPVTTGDRGWTRRGGVHFAVALALLVGAAALAPATACRGAAVSTATDDVAPILARRCLDCHGAGGISPTLAGTGDAARSAAAIGRAVERREMPPWGPDETGLCGTFMDARWLPPDEIATLRAWASAAPSAPPSSLRLRDDAPPAQDGAGARGAGGATVVAPAPRVIVVDPGVDFAPGLGAGASRCFLVPPVATKDVVVTAVVGSGAAALQLSVHVLTDDAARAAAQGDDDDDDAPGWPCPAAGPPGALLAVAWSYVTPHQALRDGLRVKGGVPLVLQVRADLVALGLDAVVHPRLTLELGDDVAGGALVPVRARAADDERRSEVRPEAGEGGRVEVRAEHRVAARSRLLGVVPRLGPAGKTMEVAVVRGEGRTCAAWFGHWRATQEQLYRRREPIALAPGDIVQLTCVVAADNADACAADLYVAPVEGVGATGS